MGSACAYIEASKVVTLHLYAPRSNLGFRPLDQLTLYVSRRKIRHEKHVFKTIPSLESYSDEYFMHKSSALRIAF
ncbi:hypothetical protein ACQKWADRAFT_265287 [Trichoderma austrokoningii]